MRKLFSDGVTARNGTVCDDCRHPRCRANLRVHLQEGPVVHVLDLAPSAAKGLRAFADALEAEQTELDDVTVRLTVAEEAGSCLDSTP